MDLADSMISDCMLVPHCPMQCAVPCCAVSSLSSSCYKPAGASNGEGADTISIKKNEVATPGGGRGGSEWKRLMAAVNYHGRRLLGKELAGVALCDVGL
jgi:hypothetical protein